MIFVFADFLLRRVVLTSDVLNISRAIGILININYFVIFFFLFAVVFYRFYNKFFYKEIPIAVIGCAVIFLSAALIFLKDRTFIFEALSAIFLAFFIIISYKSIVPLIKTENISEKEKFLFVFILLYLISSALNFLAAVFLHIVFKIFLRMYFLYDIHSYFVRLSSYSFIVFSFIYFSMFFNALNKKRIFATLLSAILLSALFLSLKDNLSVLFIYALEALKIEAMISSMNTVFILLILIVYLSNVIYTSKNSFIIYLFFLSIAGINIMDLFNMLLILFVLTDLESI